MAHFTPKYAYYGKGIFHVTLSITEHSPLLGNLIVPEGDIENAHIERSALGEEVVTLLSQLPKQHSQIELFAYELMPDHLHYLLHIKDELPKEHGIRRVLHFYRIACNQAAEKMGLGTPFTEPAYITLCSREGQLQTLFDYIHDNPKRLALKRSMPNFFRTMRNVTINGTSYDAVGNIGLLQLEHRQTVHVHKELVWMAEREGNGQPLRNYMNNCILEARKGVVSVSPFISPNERRVLEVLLREEHPIIYIRDNGFSQYFKPSGALIEACAKGRLLLLSPYPYVEDKPPILRTECVALNALADAIVQSEN